MLKSKVVTIAAAKPKRIDITAEFAELQKNYASDPRQSTFNVLLLGDGGTGKTYMSKTCEMPVHFDSFDPGGTKSVRDLIAKGLIYADTRFENEDPLNPTAFALWETEFKRRKAGGYFEQIGTYYLDSSTMWAQAAMNLILKKAGRPGKAPLFNKDYTPQKIAVRNYLLQILDLPCDVVVTGHLAMNTDEVTGRVTYRYQTTGRGTVELPTLFDEVYVMDPVETSKGIQRRILTTATGRHMARSRLGMPMYVDPDFKAIKKLAGIKP